MDSIIEKLKWSHYKEYNTDVAVGIAHGMAGISGLLAASSLILSFRNRSSAIPSILFGSAFAAGFYHSAERIQAERTSGPYLASLNFFTRYLELHKTGAKYIPLGFAAIGVTSTAYFLKGGLYKDKTTLHQPFIKQE